MVNATAPLETRNLRELPMLSSVPAGAVFAVQGTNGPVGTLPLVDLIMDGIPGEPGADARSIKITSSSNRILYNQAGVVAGQTVVFYALRQNSNALANWEVRTLPDGVLRFGAAAIGNFLNGQGDVRSLSSEFFNALISQFTGQEGISVRAFMEDGQVFDDVITVFAFRPGQQGANGVDGVDGVDGTDGIFREFVWRRAANKPARPSGNGIPANWFDDPPAGTDPLWISVARQELNGVLIAGEVWSDPIRHDGPPGNPGANGVDGVDGTDGIFREFVWRRAANKPARPSGNGIPANWFDDPPAGTDPLWISVARQELNGVLIAGEVWSDPIRHDGPPGTNGSNGINGAPGENGLSATLNPPSLPVACFANGVVKPDAFTGLSAQFEIFSGAALQSAGWTFSIVSGLSVAASGTVSAGGLVTPTAVSDDDAYLVVRATNGATVIDRTLRLPKVRDGGSGVSKSVNITTLPTSSTFVEVASIDLEIPPQIPITISAGAGYLVNGPGSYTPNMKLMLQDLSAGGSPFDVGGANVFGSPASNTGGIEPEFFDGSVSVSSVVPNGHTSAKLFRLLVMVRRSGGGQSVAVTFGRATISAGG